MTGTNIYEQHLERNGANFVPLSPLTYLRRAASVYPDRVAQIHGDRRITWSETYARCRRFASALAHQGVGIGDTVAVMAPNVPALFEAHFAVPMAGAVLNALNTRLDAAGLAFILNHGEAKALITDRAFSGTMKQALAEAGRDILVIDIDDPAFTGEDEGLGTVEYEDFLDGGDPAYGWLYPADEWQACCLNYTSGTTGNPKGVVYSHRGAYLIAAGNAITWGIPMHPVYLWTLPMFHCNGWGFPWTVALTAGTSVCLRKVEAGAIFRAIEEHVVDHFCGAPVVLGFIINAGDEQRRPVNHPVKVMTAGAPPPSAVLLQMERCGFDVTHVYGLTEVYGPCVVCAPQDGWDLLSDEERAETRSRQGVTYPMQEDMMVADPETLEPVAQDGETMGEIMLRGNLTMKGYLKNPGASDQVFKGGWFHTGDLGVWHADGYIQIRDRSKDIIISGGENISSIEVEDVLYKHPAVMTAAVVAMRDEKWGETPCAFIELKPDTDTTEDEIIAFCRHNLAKFKCPRHVVFGEVPKTSTGKVQKFKLRDRLPT